ncbi:hypothetical protein B5S33_g2914 [[Candida] boidinii]|nr:hypothetical protein B5S33_g2914 [[Candida] boidinii]
MSNRTAEKKEHGNLLAVVVSKARDLPNRRKFDKQTPYCVVRIQDQVQTTQAIPRAGQNPEWDSELWFSLSGVTDYKMSFNIYHETKKEVGLVCKATIDFSQALTKPSKVGFDKWYDLEYDGKPAGQIFLEMSYYPPVDNVSLSNSLANKKFQYYKSSQNQNQNQNHPRALHNSSVSSRPTNKIDFNAIDSITLPPLPSMENQTSNFYKNSTGIKSFKDSFHSKFDSFEETSNKNEVENLNSKNNDEISSSFLPPLSELDADNDNNNHNNGNRNTWYTKINDYAKGFFPKNMTNYTDIFGVATSQPELSPHDIPNPISPQQRPTSHSHFDELEDSFHNVSSNDVFTGFSDDDEDDDAYYQHKQKILNSKKNPTNFNNNAYISPVQSNEGSQTSLHSHSRKHSDHVMNDATTTDILHDDEIRKSFQKRPLPSMPGNFSNSNNALPSIPKFDNSNIISGNDFGSDGNTGLTSNYLQKTAPTPQDTDSVRDRSSSPRRVRRNKNELQHTGSLSYAQIRKLNERKKNMI